MPVVILCLCLMCAGLAYLSTPKRLLRFQSAITIAVACVAGLGASHLIYDREMDAWGYTDLVDAAKEDPVARAGLARAMSDGTLTYGEYRGIADDHRARERVDRLRSARREARDAIGNGNSAS